MTTEPQKPQGWWQTLPGVLTAAAAAITAISGLAAVLFQSGHIGGQGEAVAKPPPVSQARADVARGDNGTSASAVARSLETRKQWSDAEAVVLSRDGATTRLRADSFSNCISVDHEMHLENGQSMPFERISSFEVLHADDHTSSNPKAKLNIQLADGKSLSGTVVANCDLFGYNELGRFSIYWDQLRGVRFER